MNNPTPEFHSQPPLIDFTFAGSGGFKRRIGRCIDSVANVLIRHHRINESHEALRSLPVDDGNFFQRGLKVLNIRYQVKPEDVQRIPTSGPLIIVANHPFGGVDGIVLGAVIAEVRTDAKLMVNYLLARIDGFAPHIINVDPFGSKSATHGNLAPMRQCFSWLRGGGCLGVFPSGTVSHWNWRKRRVTDPQWSEHIASLALKTRATVVPVFFEGRNNALFQLAGILHPLLRTILLPRQMLAMNGKIIKLRVGNPIGPSKLERFASPREGIDFLRLKTYIQQNREVAEKVSFRFSRPFRKVQPAAIADPIDRDLLAREVTQLTEAHEFARYNELSVIIARAKEIPLLLKEIGRLREITFRAVGEGTNLSRDLDRFDDYYLHLFMWNHEKQEIAGAYRLGLTDEILNSHGTTGLYTTTLFRYKQGVLERLNPAVELGRSFVVADYQRKPMSLGLMWKGIGQFIARHPRYRILFGPVSISKEYQALSKNMIVMYLKENSLDPELSHQVKARKPPRSKHLGGLDQHSFNTTVRDIEDVSALISEIEREERGVPVLLRQYLKLNATMLSFNVDPEFNDCIDGLVLVDLSKTNEKTLRRYMGDEGAERFYAFHEIRNSERTVKTSGG